MQTLPVLSTPEDCETRSSASLTTRCGERARRVSITEGRPAEEEEEEEESLDEEEEAEEAVNIDGKDPVVSSGANGNVYIIKQ